MNRIIAAPILLLILGATLQSCVKTRNCTCVTRDSDGNEIARSNTLLDEMSRSEAKTECQSHEGSAFGWETNCFLD